MGLVSLPTFTIRINHSWFGKYTVRPMDASWDMTHLGFVAEDTIFRCMGVKSRYQGRCMW